MTSKPRCTTRSALSESFDPSVQPPEFCVDHPRETRSSNRYSVTGLPLLSGEGPPANPQIGSVLHELVPVKTTLSQEQLHHLSTFVSNSWRRPVLHQVPLYADDTALV